MKISVALCTYNGEKYLNKQLDSIFAQSVKVDEIVICDDISSDKTIEIINEYKEKYPNIIKLYVNEKNLRSVKNFEKAISLCTGDIIFLSDQDDYWESNKVETILRHFEENKNIKVVATNGACIDENSNPIDYYTIWDIPQFLKLQNININYFKTITQVGNIATGASMAIKKSFTEQCFPFPVMKDFHHDEWIAIVAAYHNSFSLIDEKVFKYRIHSNQQVGGVCYKKTEKMLKSLIMSYNIENLNGFIAHKRRINRLFKNYKKFSNLQSIALEHSDVTKKIVESILASYNLTLEQFKKQYPTQSNLLSITDKLFNKRQFKN